jgi:hypothetical protein
MRSEPLFTYPFAWIDQVIEVTLNPACHESPDPAADEIELIRQNLRPEFRVTWGVLKRQSFCLLPVKRYKAVVTGYYQYLLKSRDQVVLFLPAYPEGHPVLALCHETLEQLEELIQQVRIWYGPLLPDGAHGEKRPEAITPSFKILCRLTVDQVAIVLKAADEVRLLTARSFSLVLRTIVPFLSTERLQDFSWKSARSSTYKMEGSDKEIAIRALEALIEKIRQY